MNELPANQRLARKDAFYSMILAPLEYVTRSLMKGDPWELTELQQVANRCRALADAFDRRMAEARIIEKGADK